MIPSLATIVAAYVMLRCVEIALRPASSFNSNVGHGICVILAVLVIFVAGLELIEILSAGAKVGDTIPSLRGF